MRIRGRAGALLAAAAIFGTDGAAARSYEPAGDMRSAAIVPSHFQGAVVADPARYLACGTDRDCHLALSTDVGVGGSPHDATIAVPAQGGRLPDPESWWMLILGFGAAGYAMRPRQSAPARIRFRV